MNLRTLTSFAVFLMLFAFSGCKKDDEAAQLAKDIEQIENYLTENQLQAEKLDSGLHYIIITAGGADHPVVTSNVTVSYKGTFLDGTLLDQGSFFTSRLTNLITGWQQGIPLIGTGGKIKLFIPSGLAYGNADRPSVPANSVLIFEVTLHYFSE